MFWDIETYTSEKRLPLPENKDDYIFLIGISFSWTN